jgi:chaperonin GroES
MNDRKWRGDNEKIRRKKRQALNALLVNIADSLSEQERESIAQVCLEDFRSDMESRSEWDAMHADWVAVYNQQDAPVNRPWPNSSDESLGLLTEACNSFQSRAYKAFFASRMPVAAISTNPSVPGSSERAKRVSQFLQWSLFFKDQTYKEDKSAMLLRVAVHGSDFTKTYFDPVMNKIVTRAVRAEDLYVPYHIGPINIEDVHRKTELIHINLNEGRIRASEGYFLVPPEPMMIGQLSSPIQEQNDRDNGIHASATQSEDMAQIIEQHCHLDLDGDGIAEPYKIWIDVTSEKLLRIEVRYEVDQTGRPLNGRLPIEEYTHYRFLVNPDGFYGYGLGFLLGKTNIAVNKLLRQFIDATTLSIHGNMSGFISEALNISKGPVKIELGSLKTVSASTDDIQKGIKTLSFPAPPPTLMQAIAQLETRAQRIGATTDAAAGDINKVFQPTTMQTMVEQSLVMFTSVQEFLLHSWSKELNKIYRLHGIYFRGIESFISVSPEGPEEMVVSDQDFMDDMLIMPVADPRMMNQQSRLQKAQFLFDFATKNPLVANNPEVLLAVSRRLLEEMEIDGIDSILPRSVDQLPEPAPDPKAMAEQAKVQVEQQKLQLEAQSAQQQLQIEAQKMQVDQQMKQAQMVGDQQLQQLRIENERMLQEMRIQNEAEIARMKQEYENVRVQKELAAKQSMEAQKAKMEADTKIMVARIGAAGADVPGIEAVTSSTQQLATSMGEDVRSMISQMEAQNAARDQRMMQMIQSLMQSMGAPRRIIRGADGRAEGVEVVPGGMMQ